MKFDIDAIVSASELTFDVNVGRRDDGTAVGFRVLGPSSEAYARADREAQVFGVKESAARGKFAFDGTTDEGAAAIVDGLEKRADIVLSHCVVAWYGFTIGESEPAPFTLDNLRRVLRAKPLWRKILMEAIETEANFAKG